MTVKNRALTIATGGLLAGSPLAIATDGLIQPDAGSVVRVHESTHRHTSDRVRLTLPAAGPELVQPIRAGGGPIYLAYSDRWQAYKHTSVARLALMANSAARLHQAKPVEVLATFSGVHRSQAVLQVAGEATTRYWEDDTDELVLLAMKLLRG